MVKKETNRLKEKVSPNKRESVANKFTLKELREALSGYSPNESLAGVKNGMFSGGYGEKYRRIRINGLKVKMSHIVWRLTHKKKIPKGYNIHHIDENKRNDSPENLELVEAVAHGKFNLKYCGAEDTKNERFK